MPRSFHQMFLQLLAEEAGMMPPPMGGPGAMPPPMGGPGGGMPPPMGGPGAGGPPQPPVEIKTTNWMDFMEEALDKLEGKSKPAAAKGDKEAKADKEAPDDGQSPAWATPPDQAGQPPPFSP